MPDLGIHSPARCQSNVSSVREKSTCVRIQLELELGSRWPRFRPGASCSGRLVSYNGREPHPHGRQHAVQGHFAAGFLQPACPWPEYSARHVAVGRRVAAHLPNGTLLPLSARPSPTAKLVGEDWAFTSGSSASSTPHNDFKESLGDVGDSRSMAQTAGCQGKPAMLAEVPLQSGECRSDRSACRKH